VFFYDFFWTWPDVVRTGLTLAAFILVVLIAWRAVVADNGKGPSRSESALTYLLVLVGLTLLPMIFLVGESWQRPRYLTMLLPVMDLLAAGALWRLGQRLSVRARVVAGMVLWLAVMIGFLPAAIHAIGPAEPAYDEAFRYVQQHWQAGDAVIGPLPSIAATYLGQCDGYALQNEYEEYVLSAGTEQVDRWTGAPLINSAAAFHRQFAPDRRVWLVVDDVRWDQRYDTEFKQFIAERMVPIHEASGVTVYQRPPAPTHVSANR
jgi:4-amino-4-deoxy-L-arabinose transferase-like glycosyltransferase